ncbi:MAG: DMT family transporter [Terrisporobacter othiniensis]|uniref:DMT family transporter n=1 Tax=Terrisporobacter petrolearius TaxID=1460447 RepID=UPI0022E89D2F|nr:DMT family transporter [Terrisporobacter petrolearius]MDU4859372.1 DMT family transporter [Terrisporobacter othiniensis]MDU6993759.1 DMT family transporter [Terrisporobacter othiniensis]
MKKYKLGLIISMLIWGSIGIFVKYINFTSSQIALVRAIVGSIFLIIFSMISKESLSKEKIKSNLLVLICCGICLGFNWIFLFQAYHYTTVSTATICYYLAPIIVMFLSPFLLKEKLNSVKVCCIVAAMIGMLCIVGIDKSSMGENNMVGILYGLSAACFYTGVVILNKFLKGISGRDSAIVQLSVSAIFLLPYVIFTEKISLVGVSSQSIILLLVLGVVHTGIAYLLYFTVIQKIESQTVASYSYVDPISAIFMSAIILNESMSLLQIIGGILILGSTFISEVYSNKIKSQEFLLESVTTEKE